MKENMVRSCSWSSIICSLFEWKNAPALPRLPVNVHINLCQSKHVHHTVYSTKIFIMNKHMSHTTWNALKYVILCDPQSTRNIPVNVWCCDQGNHPKCLNQSDQEMHPTFLHICRIRISSWLHLLSPAVQRFGLEACLQSFERMPWEQAAAEKQVNTDC